MRLGVALLIALGCWLVGCEKVSLGPALLEVTALHPSAVEGGDRVEILGSGFPEGRRGTVTFGGEVYRPGSAPVRVRGVVAEVVAASRKRLRLEVDPELVAAFCGRGRESRHATFKGDLLVAFSPFQPGAPPVTGRLAGVELDWQPPPASDDLVAARLDVGRAALATLGVVVERADQGTVVVSSLDPDGRAARAGLQPGDTLLGFAGVRVGDEADFAVPPGMRQGTVRLRRGRHEDPVDRVIDLDGISSAPPDSLTTAGFLVAIAVAVMLLFAAPLGRLFTWAERRMVSQVQVAVSPRAPPRQLARHIISDLAETLLPDDVPALARVLPYLALLGITALFTLLAFDGVVVATEADLPLGILAGITGLVCVGLVAGGRLSGPHWSLRAGLRTALVLLGFQLPLLATLASVVVLVGSTRVRDLVLSQGAAPWEWHVFTSPASTVGVVLVLLVLTPRPVGAPRAIPEVDRPPVSSSPTSRAARAFLVAADSGHVLLVSSLVALVLLGGYQVPGVPPTAQAANLSLQVLGAVLLAAKTWSFVSLVAALRWVVPELRHDEVTGLAWRLVLPASFATVGIALAWGRGIARPLLDTLEGGFGVVLSALVLVTLVLMGGRVLRRLWRPTLQIGVNPWL
ncbi:MAG: NADH-quinone oxidoreductase subunit H [Polyangiaceae bacterium]|nr:NADH-quinone oxidoreductase subunit H [Polyangiaceae bacterium]